MKLESIFRPGVFSIQADESLTEAAGKMEFEEIGSLAVMWQSRFAGIITERDLVRAIADGVDPAGTPVARYMTADPVVASPEDGAHEAAARMVVLGVRHLPVVVSGKVVGMVSIRDLMAETLLV